MGLWNTKIKILLTTFLLVFSQTDLLAQDSTEISGQVSIYTGYAPENDLSFMTGARYLPQIDFSYKFENETEIGLEASANIYDFAFFSSFDSISNDYDIKPYRLWLRYSGKQFDIRAGLQKINFGSATILRPLQWFDEVDPTDPLQFTNGVYALLFRYYFLNNANIWLWGLYGNQNPRGFEIFSSNKNKPEYGGRIQLPVPSGEIALTYNHRTASTKNISILPLQDSIPEDKFAVDGKWDLGIGLWFEGAVVKKYAQLGAFSAQTMLTVGASYTFGIGNGLGVSSEHLLLSMDSTVFGFDNAYNITSLTLTYPLGFFDNFSLISFYIWEAKKFMISVNYSHDFKIGTLYVMPFYIPDLKQNILGNNYTSVFTGYGIRLIFVYYH